MFGQLINETFLDDAAADWAVFKTTHAAWRNQQALWRKFIRAN